MGEELITPQTGPKIDGEGRLTYLGDDGRRYVVLSGGEFDSESSWEIMEALKQASPIFQEIEALSMAWLDQVRASPLSKEEALNLLFATLETVLEPSLAESFLEQEIINDISLIEGDDSFD